jgi:hypothetical protein
VSALRAETKRRASVVRKKGTLDITSASEMHDP